MVGDQEAQQRNGTNSRDVPESKGILVTEGAEFSIHGLQMSVGPEGLQVSHDKVTLRQDLVRHWLRIALGHLRDSDLAHEEVMKADPSTTEGQSLEREFRASMQAMVASVIALDAFYAAVKDRVEIPRDHLEAWKTKKTARWSQMTEVFRLAFGLDKNQTRGLRTDLEEIMKYRDWAVHPPAKAKRPAFRNDIGLGVEWRFAAFRHSNALKSVGFALHTIYGLAKNATTDTETLVEYCQGVVTALDPLIAHWKEICPSPGARD